MIEDSSFESFAHYASGMAAMSFVMWAVILYGWRKRNRMTFLLFLVVAYIALGFLKDVIFFWPSHLFSNLYFLEDMVSIFDISFVPLVCAFFIEATWPGVVTNKRLLLSYLAFILFLPLYCLFQSKWVVVGSFWLSLIAALVTLVVVPINVKRYNKYLSDNYSYINNIGVGWCTGCASFFFLALIFYQICFYEPTWFGEMIYDAVFVVTWNIVCLYNRNHQVVAGIIPSADIQQIDTNGNVADSLRRCMETDKLYLNPLLTLMDLAQAAGTDKTGISTYINGHGKTFYDYVNEYRVAEACRIIDKKVVDGERISMTDVALQSGFNSISTFNRYFTKLKGITPTSYSRR